MPCSVLYKSRFVTEAVATVRPHTMEMSLMFPIATMWVFTIFIESENRFLNFN